MGLALDEGFAVIIAAILAILGILYSSRQQRKLLRKQHTFQIIDKLNGWSELEECVSLAARLRRDVRIPTICDSDHKSDCDKLDFLLNYYEVLASAIICGDIDEELVRRMERGRFTRTYLSFLPYIEEARDELDSLQVWENLEFITYRWVSSKGDPFDNLIDQFFLRPTMNHLPFQRDNIRERLWIERQKIKFPTPE